MPPFDRPNKWKQSPEVQAIIDAGRVKAHLLRVQKLIELGWDTADADRYAELFRIKIGEVARLADEEKTAAKKLEEKYRDQGALPNFGFFEQPIKR